MCQYKIVIVRSREVSPELKGLFQSMNFSYDLVQQDSLIKKFGNRYSYILATKGECDCGSIIGFDAEEEFIPRPDENKLRLKLRKKGWSEAKISRNIKDTFQHIDKREQNEREEHRKEEVNWIGLIAECIECKTLSKLGIIYHQFNGSIETEKIIINDEGKIRFSKFSINKLRDLKENKVLWIS